MAASISFISVNVPLTVFVPTKKFIADHSNGSSDTAAMITSPPTHNPLINGFIAFALGAVAMITFAPPKSFNDLAISSVSASM